MSFGTSGVRSRLELRRPRRPFTLLSFERSGAVLVPGTKTTDQWVLIFPLGGRYRAHLENSIVTIEVFFLIKRIRVHGGCLGAESR